MKLTWKFIGIALICFSFALTGCEETDGENDEENVEPNGEECEVDEDCGDDICVTGSCIETCENDADCNGDFCLERPDGGAEMTCQSLGQDPCDDDSDCDPGVETCEDNPIGDDPAMVCVEMPRGQSCDNQEDCPRFDEFCDTGAGECKEGEHEPYVTILIQDETDEFGDVDDEGNNRCDDKTLGHETAGAKLMYVELTNRDTGDLIAHGTYVDFMIGDNAFFGDVTEVLDGNAPPYSGECPDVESDVEHQEGGTFDTNFTEQHIVALGCGGWVTLQFRDNGDTIELTEDHTIWVGEFGPSCVADPGEHDSQTGDDAFDVYLCKDASRSSTDLGTCEDTPLNQDPASGIFPVDVTFP